MSKSIKNNTILNAIKTLASIIFPIITFPYVNRVLLPDNVGKVNFAVSFVSYFALIASLGISTYAVRICSTNKESKEELSNTASQLYSINWIMTVIAYLALIITMIFFRKLDSYRILVIIESITILGTTIGADWLNSAMEDFKYITIRSVGFQLLALVLMFIFVHHPDDYVKYAIINVVSSTGANITNFFYRKKYCKVRFTLKIDWKIHIMPIICLFVMMLSQTIFNNVDITMLGTMWNDYEVGIYTTAHKVTLLIGKVVQSLAMVIIPRLSLYFAKNDYEGANNLLRKVLLFNIGLGLPCVIGVIMMAEDISFLVGGAEFSEAAPVMRVLILSFMFSLVGGSFLGNAILIPTKQEKYYMIVCCITAVANCFLNWLLIPKLAATGAAISTAFNGFLIMVLLFFKIDKRIKIERIPSVFIGPLIGCAAIAACCFGFSYIDNLWARVIGSVSSSIISYALVLIITKNEFGTEIVRTLGSKFKK